MRLSWRLKDMAGVNYILIENINGQGRKEHLLSTAGSLTITGYDKTTYTLKLEETPATYFLAQNFPNPFNPSTTIRYELPKASHVTLKVYNMLGQEVAQLVDEMQDAGFKSVEWDARQGAGGQASNLPSGVYFYKLTAGSFVDVKKMLFVK